MCSRVRVLAKNDHELMMMIFMMFIKYAEAANCKRISLVTSALVLKPIEANNVNFGFNF